MVEIVVRIEQHHQISITFNLILFFLLFTLVIFLISFYKFITLSHSIYSAGYIVLSAMFDAVDPSIGIIALQNILSINFFELFSIFILDGITKIVIIGFILASFLNIFSNINIKSKLNLFNIKKLKKHVIICGFSMLGEELSSELKQRNIPFVIIDKDPVKIEMLNDLKYLTVYGDFTLKKILLNAAIDNAKYIVFGTKNDYYNLLGLITAKDLNKNIKIISRATDNTSIKRIEEISEGKHIIPEEIAGTEIANKLIDIL